MSRHLIGIFDCEAGGVIAECGQCGLKFVRNRTGQVKDAMRNHYDAQHPEHTLGFKRYEWNR